MSTPKRSRWLKKAGLRTLIFLLVMFSAALSACQYGYHICACINGRVLDSLTHEPLSGVSVKVYDGKYLECADSTENEGIYSRVEIELIIGSTPGEIRELKAKPPLRREEELRIVFEKQGYRKSELLVPVEFIYCSPHPNPVEIPVVTIPDVLLVPE